MSARVLRLAALTVAMGTPRAWAAEGAGAIEGARRTTPLDRDRWEIAPVVGVIGGWPVEEQPLSGVSLARHVGGGFAIDATWGLSPDFGEDWKPITSGYSGDEVLLPDLTRVDHLGLLSLQYRLARGQVGWSGRDRLHFDVSVSLGTGFVGTRDDLVALQGEGDPQAIATEVQVHPTTGVGGGVRILFAQHVALRLEGRALSYIETFASTTLELHVRPLGFVAVSFLVPTRRAGGAS